MSIVDDEASFSLLVAVNTLTFCLLVICFFFIFFVFSFFVWKKSIWNRDIFTAQQQQSHQSKTRTQCVCVCLEISIVRNGIVTFSLIFSVDSFCLGYVEENAQSGPRKFKWILRHENARCGSRPTFHDQIFIIVFWIPTNALKVCEKVW